MPSCVAAFVFLLLASVTSTSPSWVTSLSDQRVVVMGDCSMMPSRASGPWDLCIQWGGSTGEPRPASANDTTVAATVVVDVTVVDELLQLEGLLLQHWPCDTASDRCGPDVVVLTNVVAAAGLRLRGLLIDVALSTAASAVILIDTTCVSVRSYVRTLSDAKYALGNAAVIDWLPTVPRCPVVYVPTRQSDHHDNGRRSHHHVHREAADMVPRGSAIVSSDVVHDGRSGSIEALARDVRELRALARHHLRQDPDSGASSSGFGTERYAPLPRGVVGGRHGDTTAGRVLRRLALTSRSSSSSPTPNRRGVDSDGGNTQDACPMQFTVLVVGNDNERFVFNQTAWMLVESLTALGFAADVVVCGTITDADPTLGPGRSCNTWSLWRRQIIVLGANTLSRVWLEGGHGAGNGSSGGHQLAVLSSRLQLLPRHTILYQFEHITRELHTTQWMTAEYMSLLREFDVWDYSR